MFWFADSVLALLQYQIPLRHQAIWHLQNQTNHQKGSNVDKELSFLPLSYPLNQLLNISPRDHETCNKKVCTWDRIVLLMYVWFSYCAVSQLSLVGDRVCVTNTVDKWLKKKKMCRRWFSLKTINLTIKSFNYGNIVCNTKELAKPNEMISFWYKIMAMVISNSTTSRYMYMRRNFEKCSDVQTTEWFPISKLVCL